MFRKALPSKSSHGDDQIVLRKTPYDLTDMLAQVNPDNVPYGIVVACTPADNTQRKRNRMTNANTDKPTRKPTQLPPPKVPDPGVTIRGA